MYNVNFFVSVLILFYVTKVKILIRKGMTHMKEITLRLEEKVLKMLEEITDQHNNEIGINVSKEETLAELIVAHYYCEVLTGKKAKESATCITINIS